MNKGLHQREKALSVKSLLKVVREVFDFIPNHRRERKISLTDVLMSALAVFSIKSPSLLAFDKHRLEGIVRHNLKTLYRVKNAPSDTYMREILDEVDPKVLRKSFLSVFHKAQRGKVLEHYTFLGGYLCLVDGTEVFNSEQIHCKNCIQKKHKDGRITYHHQILGAAIAHPDVKHVIPLCPESITRQDGESKNDCERNAFYRFIKDLKKEHPRLKLTMVSDALSANAPHINKLKFCGYNFIIGVKSKGNKTLFDRVKGVKKEIKMEVDKNKYLFRYVNQVPLNNTKKAPLVNFLECEAEEVRGNRVFKKYFSWVTDHKITDKNVYQLMRGGRARWKIENETFNTLKNQGYQFEHNFGHGKKYLHTVFAFTMMLAFLIDQLQEFSCKSFQAALNYLKTRSSFWERMRSFFYTYLIPSWEVLYESINPHFKGAVLGYDTS